MRQNPVMRISISRIEIADIANAIQFRAPFLDFGILFCGKLLSLFNFHDLKIYADWQYNLPSQSIQLPNVRLQRDGETLFDHEIFKSKLLKNCFGGAGVNACQVYDDRFDSRPKYRLQATDALFEF